MVLVVGLILVGGFAVYPDLANAQSGFNFQGKERGYCKLTNVQAGRELYNGTCIIKETIDGSKKLYEIRMGSTEPFLLANADGVTWMHGPEQVRFWDRGHTGIFRWGDFRLEVNED